MNAIHSRQQLEQAARDYFMSTNATAYRFKVAGPALTTELNQGRFRIDQGDGGARQLILPRHEWNRVEPFSIETKRMGIRPVAQSDIKAFHRIAGQRSVARRLVNLDHPLSYDAAISWLKKRKFRGRPGFMVGIYENSSHLAGAIGLGGMSNALVYFLDERCRGRGLGAEAVGGFTRYCRSRFLLRTISAGVFTDNPVSRHLLENLGFEVVGQKPFQSPARTTPQMIWEMLWSAGTKETRR